MKVNLPGNPPPLTSPQLSPVGMVQRRRRLKMGTVLAEIMMQRGLTQLPICQVLRVSQRQLYNLLARTRPLSPLAVVSLAQALDCDPDALVDADGFLRASSQG